MRDDVKLRNCPIWWDPNALPPAAISLQLRLWEFLAPWIVSAHPVAGAIVHGTKGTCKTSACLFLLERWAGHGFEAEFQDWGELVIRCRSAWKSSTKETVDDILLREMMRPRILLLDDMGKRSTPEDQEYSGILLKGRHDRGLITIVTTNHNCDPATDGGKGISAFLSAIDDRGADRFANCYVKATGENIRLER